MVNPVDAAISRIYDSVLEPAAWPQVLAQLALAFEAHAATVWRFDLLQRRMIEVTSHGHDPEALALYAEHYVHLDPATPKVLAAGVGRWLGDETLLDPHQAAHRTYLHEFALPNGLGRVGGGQVASDAGSCLYLGVQRRGDAPRFGSVAAELFAALAPHLARADAMRQHMAWLQRTGPLRLQSGAIRPRADALRVWWPQALLDACGSRSRARAVRVAVDADRAAEAWCLWLLPVSPEHALSDGREEPCALLVGGRSGSYTPAKALQAALREVYGLTPAEAEWLLALAGGETAPVFASRRGVSIHTVRTHSAALMSKLGCRSQLELAALAREFPRLRDD